MNHGGVTVTVNLSLSFEQALILQMLCETAIEGSGKALEVIPSVEAKARLVERRADLFDLKDLLTEALYRAKIEMDT